jgi:hypothetical protein
MDGYSQFFTFEDLTNSESHPNLVPQNRTDAGKFQNSGKRLSKLLETIRHLFGDKPIKVDSGFRNTALNSAVGSIVPASAHTRFEAADIVPSNMTIAEAFNTLMEDHKAGLLPDLRKVLMEGTWLHVETSMSAGDYRGFFVSKDGNLTFEKVA